MAAKWSEIRAEAITGDESVSLAPCNYYGFTFSETTDADAALVRIYDSDTATGTILDTIKLAAGESVADFYPGGLRAEEGLYVDVVSGTVEGSVRVER